jgi:3',5'-cyclic AMP phosphodiesterase CpdA
MPTLSRRQFIAAAGGAAGTVAAGGLLSGHVWPLLTREDLIPGTAPEAVLDPGAWPSAADRVRFAAIGDNGSGGRQAMAVAARMAEAYREAPFGHVVLLGDICYYGNFEDRYDDVFRRPMGPLIDAGVGFELAIGNHDEGLRHSDEGADEIQAELRLLGTPSRYYASNHGPVDFFFLDSSQPGAFGSDSRQQWEWLDDTLAAATSQWRVACLHHPLYSSGRHGSTLPARKRLEPILRRHRVDLVLAGHDHHYERTHPIDGITYVVSGGGCKTTRVGRSSFTEVAASLLQFLVIDVSDDRLTGHCTAVDGAVVDRFELRPRDRR